jgi:hypothetical protein
VQIVITDGGRLAAGYTGKARGDCVPRAIAIATGRPYREVYERLSAGKGAQRASSRTARQNAHAGSGIHTGRKWFKDYMLSLGFVWVPTMSIGSGCKVHLRAGELPNGRLVVSVSKHMVAVIDGVLLDNHDSSRGGRRCVYGYWRLV